MSKQTGNWLASISSRVISPADNEEQKLNKTLLVFACGLMGFAAMVWLLLYWAMGIKFSLAVPVGYQLVSALTLLIYLKTRNFKFFRFAQVSLFLFVPFIMQWSIGSYISSSGVMLWALLAPLGMVIFQGPKESVPWFIAYIFMTGISAFFDYYIYHGMTPDIPVQTISVFFALNFAAMSTIVYLLFALFVREKGLLQHRLNMQHKLVHDEKEKSESLLRNVLPQHIAERLKQKQAVVADGYADVTVMFADIVGFTRFSEEMAPNHVVALLNKVFSGFDELAAKYKLEKIKTVGDAYMVVGGIAENTLDYAAAVVDMALEARIFITQFETTHHEKLSTHIGISTGPIIAGVIGVSKFNYDVWGNTVNIASRLSSETVADGIRVDEVTYKRLRTRYRFEGPDVIYIKGKGEMSSYRLIEKL